MRDEKDFLQFFFKKVRKKDQAQQKKADIECEKHEMIFDNYKKIDRNRQKNEYHETFFSIHEKKLLQLANNSIRGDQSDDRQQKIRHTHPFDFKNNEAIVMRVKYLLTDVFNLGTILLRETEKSKQQQLRVNRNITTERSNHG